MSTAAPHTQHSGVTAPAPTRKGPSVGTWRPWAVLPWALALLALPLIALALRSNFGANGWMTVVYMLFGALPHELFLMLMVGSLFLLPRVNPLDEQRGGIRLGRLLHTLLGVCWGSFALAAILFPDAGDHPDSAATTPVLMDLLGKSTAMDVGSVAGLALAAVSALTGLAVIVVCVVRRIRVVR
ncbi:hypothetical protein [Micrococcus endophyticus]|uniref:Uncharacterized protein n=1 Tax=Micrococcus endophyticus TaxID=455343 RepID=A0A7W9JKY3_9MICC|nr:hypothetical protein [Micrococcus endophyticus]MBB5849192.1 hypothetical protein [Micrococcus endophyticus]